MSYLDVSGLSGGGEDDALRRLMGGSASADADEPGSNPFLEAMMKVNSSYPVTQDVEEDRRVSVPTVASEAAVVPADGSGTAPGCGGNQDATRRPAPRGQAEMPPEAQPAPSGRADQRQQAQPQSRYLQPPGAQPQVYNMAELKQETSSFQADNPTDIDALPPLAELVHPKLRRQLMETLKIENMTRIQKLGWGAMIDREKDVLVRSETGSGKTLAYALPVLHEVLCDCDVNPVTRDVGTIVVIMCPTRELVLQVTDTVSALLRGAQFLTVGGIHGGENRHKEKARLRKGIAVLVTTPGRLLDHLKTTSSFNVSNVRTMIMDEADRLLDLGFERPIREIMELMERKCKDARAMKRVLVSATITDGVERLSHFALRKNVARIGETQDTFSVPSTLRQHFVSVPTKHRLSVLISFLRCQFDAGANKIIAFVSTADSTEFLYYLMSRLQSPFNKKGNPFIDGTRETRSSPAPVKSAKKMTEMANQHVYGDNEEVVTFDEDDDSDDGGDERNRGADIDRASKKALLNVNVFKLHGNMPQVDRASVFHAFKHGNPNAPSQRSVLFCTDVAARGLDMPKVDWIVHYDPPTDPPSYIHRVGRTARIGRSGDSILFLAPHEVGYANYLVQFIQAQDGAAGAAPALPGMSERKYETFLFYLTKLDPKSNHMWVQSTAVLERAICRLVMRDDHSPNDNRRRSGFGDARDDDGDDGAGKKDNLTRIALFAYQSYIRAYAGLPKVLKRLFFPSTELHLGHIAQSFGIDKSPTELQRKLQGYVREDRELARDNRKGTVNTRSFGQNSGQEEDEDGIKKRKRQRVELNHDERYHSMLAQKQRKVTRDYIEKRRETSNSIKPLQFSEFDA